LLSSSNINIFALAVSQIRGVLTFERVTDFKLAELESWNKTESRMMDKYNSEKEVQLQPRAAMCEDIK